jgi:acetyl esterase/lipase
VTIAPEIRSWLDWGAEVGESIGSLPLPERREPLRAALDQELRRRGVTVEPVGVVGEHAVPVAGGEIRVRVFTPAGSGPHPSFVHFHGGGFVLGTIDSLFNETKCAHICNGAGCAVVTVEYRLAPDSERIAVGGESARGNLAAVVALMAHDRGGPRLSLQPSRGPGGGSRQRRQRLSIPSRSSARATASTGSRWTPSARATSPLRPMAPILTRRRSGRPISAKFHPRTC